MFYLWMCLSLFFALQSTVSSDQAVSVNCSKTAEVGQSVTLNCTINWKDGSNCRVFDIYIYTAENKSESIQCNSSLTKHICKGDRLKYVSVTVPSVTKEVNVTVEIRSYCGMAESHPVQLFPTAASVNGRGMQETSHVMAVVLCVFPTAVSIFSL